MFIYITFCYKKYRILYGSTVSPSSLKINEKSVSYEFRFITQKGISKGGKIIIIFPAKILLSNNQSTCKINGNSP